MDTRAKQEGEPQIDHDVDMQVHVAPPITSRATPTGDAALPWLSRNRARRITSRGTPCCKASEQTMALSFAAMSLEELALPVERKISAKSPLGNRLALAT